MTDVRGYVVESCGSWERWRCIACGASSRTAFVPHTVDCQWESERLGLKLERERAERAVEAAWENNG